VQLVECVKCLHGLVTSYLTNKVGLLDCIPVSSVVGRWQLRSADSGTLVVPRTRTMQSVGETSPCRARRHGTLEQPSRRT